MSSALRVLKAADLTEDRAILEHRAALEEQLDAAYEAGRIAGREEASQQARDEEAIALRSAVEAFAAATVDAAAQAMRADAEVISDVAIDLALWLCRDALAVPANLAVRIVELFETVEAPVLVRVAPSAVGALAEHLPESISVTGDDELGPGDIVVDGDAASSRLLLHEALERSRTEIISLLADRSTP